MRNRIKAAFSDYTGLASDLVNYFRRYGGFRAILRSPYTLISVIITALCFGTWRTTEWSDLPLSIIPALLGFSLAAYALLLAFGDEQFRAFLAERDASEAGANVATDNVLLGTSAIFLHFIIVQALALIFAVVAHSHPARTFLTATFQHTIAAHAARYILAFIGFYLFILSLAMSVAAGINIFHATVWYVLFKDDQRKKARQPPP